MDTGVIIVVIISLCICSLPFFIAHLKQSKKMKQVIKQLHQVANDMGSEITQHDVINDFVLGLDKKKHYLFQLYINNGVNAIKAVDLKSIKNCKTQTIVNKEDSTVIERLELHLSYTDTTKKNEVILFYNAEDNVQLGDELKAIKEWTKIINDCLND